ncbi:hypothetical protein NPIL_212091 [Nephila pilipes]|uniref:Uncharacterized protein n=1 Tax=Nephila pilipes TaxID=299642 RepID=A0A8X6MII3_NEPPI|nr:hypothetical protein NPIL_212091 [Nephila pilipes]
MRILIETSEQPIISDANKAVLSYTTQRPASNQCLIGYNQAVSLSTIPQLGASFVNRSFPCSPMTINPLIIPVGRPERRNRRTIIQVNPG